MWCLIGSPGCEKCQNTGCLPPEAEKRDTEFLSGFKGSTVDSPVNSVKIFLDVSGSMRGFVCRKPDQTHKEFLYPKLINSLPSILNDICRVHELYALGRGISEKMDEMSFLNAGRINVFSAYMTELRNESWIGEALDRINKSSRETLSIIISDLFVRREALSGSASAITGPLITALRDGRAVGILGVKSKFNGNVTDLPGPITSYPLENGVRPFYLIVVGELGPVKTLFHLLKQNLLSSFSTDKFNYIIFCKKIIEKPLNMTEVFKEDKHWKAIGVNKTPLLNSQIEEYQQFMLNFPEAELSFSINMSDYLSNDTLKISSFKVEADAWSYVEQSPDCQSAWTKLEVEPEFYRVRYRSPQLEVTLFRQSKPSLPHLYRKTCCLQLAVRINELGSTNGSNQWLTEWSLDASGIEELIRSKPEFFPTLNLNLLYRTLLQVVREETQGDLIGLFTVAFCKNER